MRFNRRNWEKYFDGSNKQTNIRLKKSKLGVQKAYTGSYYKPELLGTVEVIWIRETTFGELTELQARMDGFKNIEELKSELTTLNGKMSSDTPLFIHFTAAQKTP